MGSSSVTIGEEDHVPRRDGVDWTSTVAGTPDLSDTATVVRLFLTSFGPGSIGTFFRVRHGVPSMGVCHTEGSCRVGHPVPCRSFLLFPPVRPPVPRRTPFPLVSDGPPVLGPPPVRLPRWTSVAATPTPGSKAIFKSSVSLRGGVEVLTGKVRVQFGLRLVNFTDDLGRISKRAGGRW